MPDRRRRTAVLVTVCAAVLAINLDTTIVNVALPALSVELDAGTRLLQWIVDGYNLAFAALVLAMGSLSDKLGRRPALVAGLLGFAAASAAGALVTSAEALVAARFAMGACAALVFPTTLSIIANAYPDRRERAAALGAWGAVVGIGVAAGPVTGGLLLEHFAWPSVFWALVPVAVVTALVAHVVVPESRDPRVPPLDVAGLLLSVALLGSVVWTIIEAPEHGWLSATTLVGAAVGLLLLVAFVGRERSAAHPMLDVALFRDPRFGAASGAVTLAFFSLFGFIFLVTQYFQFVRDYGPLSTGARILPVALAIAAASVTGALLAPRVGTKVVVTTGLVSLGSSLLWVASVEVDASYVTTIVPQMVLMGLGIGLVSTPATESIMRVLPPARAGVGSAVNDATREVGGTLGVAVVGSLFASVFSDRLAATSYADLPGDALGSAQDSVGVATAVATSRPELLDGLQTAFMDAFSTACTVVGAVCLVGALAALVWLPGRRFDRSHAELAAAAAAGDERVVRDEEERVS